MTARSSFSIALFVGGAIGISGYFALLWGLVSNNAPGYVPFLGGGALIVGAVVVLVALGRYSLARANFAASLEDKASGAVADAVQSVQDKMSLANLFILNRQQVKEYETITKNQASSSFLSLQIAITVGFGFLVAGAIAAVFVHQDADKVVTGGLGAVGTLLAVYIGKTFIDTHRRASEQLNFYFQNPVLISHILLAERLSSHVSKPRRDDVLVSIVNALLAAPHPKDTLAESPRSKARRPATP